LEIAEGGVKEQTLGSSSAYRFRYHGLYLLERSKDRYVLLAEEADRVIVLRETDPLRFEFRRPLGALGSPT
jgi:hypothetical protein